MEQENYIHFPLLTVGEAAKYLGVGRKVICQLIEFDQLRSVRENRAILIEKRSLDSFRQSGILTQKLCPKNILEKPKQISKNIGVFEYKKFQAPKTKFQKNLNDLNSKSQTNDPPIIVPNGIFTGRASFAKGYGTSAVIVSVIEY